ncbi:unnamed protein product [Phytophthora fragariaefolia]|uniref:Unnamed protein product n=1 Tax=Phytophthora fragariaefolia TaxID=1490495 RepID=A0A9W6TX81_9STRA|nr:unnamed protein product [Phytophthora fragariaefolia]
MLFACSPSAAVDDAVVEQASANGHVQVLQWVQPRLEEVLPCYADYEFFGLQSVAAAAEKGCLEVVQWLLGARRAGDTETHLHQAAARGGHLHVVRWMRTHLMERIESRAMDEAAAAGSLEVVEFLHQEWAEARLESNRTSCSATARAMNGAASNGHLEVVEWLHENRSDGCTVDAMNRAAWNGHLDVVRWLHEHRSEGCTQQAMNMAAKGGHLEIVRFLHEHRREGCTYNAMDWAAHENHVEVVQWLHANRSEGCSRLTMNEVAKRGHLELIRWLHANRTEGCTVAAMNAAATNGYLDIVKFLHCNRSEGCTTAAMDGAAENNHLEIVQWLHTHRREGCSTRAMDMAARNGYLKVVQWLDSNRTEGCSASAMDGAAECGHLDIVQFLHENRTEGCTQRAINGAAKNGHLEVVRWLHENRSEGCTSNAINDAARNGHLNVMRLLHKCRQQHGTIRALDAASARGDFLMMEWLRNISSQSTEGWPMHAGLAAIANNRIEVLHWLLRNLAGATQLDLRLLRVQQLSIRCYHFEIIHIPAAFNVRQSEEMTTRKIIPLDETRDKMAGPEENTPEESSDKCLPMHSIPGAVPSPPEDQQTPRDKVDEAPASQAPKTSARVSFDATAIDKPIRRRTTIRQRTASKLATAVSMQTLIAPSANKLELLAKQNLAIANIKHPSMRITRAEKIAYEIDQYISTRRGQIFTLSVVGIMLMSIGGIVLKAVQPKVPFRNTVWESWTYMADPGSHTSLAQDVPNASEHGGVIVVLSEIDKEELEAELESQLRKVELRGTRVIFRTGTPLLSVDLLKASAHRAKSIVIMANSTGDADRSDAAVLRTVLSLKTLPELAGHIVAELRDIDNDPLVRLVGGKEVEILVSHDIIGRLVLMSARSPGLARVYSSLLGFEGNEFYFKEWPECIGVPFGGLTERFPNAIPLGIKRKNGEVFICPNMDLILENGDQILVLAEDDDTYKACPPVSIEVGKVPPPPVNIPTSERILMCGWRRDVRDMIQLLDAIVEPGTELHIICEEPIHLRNKLLLEGGLTVDNLKNIKLVHYVGNTAIRRQLEKLPWHSFTSIMILSDQSRELDIMHSDSHSLASLLLIRDLQARSSSRNSVIQGAPGYCKCISEILDPRTQRTISTSATILTLSEFIQSNELVSCILAMISENRDVRVVLDELLGPQGAFFEVESSSRYCDPYENVSFWQLAKRAMVRGDILCGYQERGADDTVLNPRNKTLPRSWINVDMIVIRNEDDGFGAHESSFAPVASQDFERTSCSRQMKATYSRQRLMEAIAQESDFSSFSGLGSDADRATIMRALYSFDSEDDLCINGGEIINDLLPAHTHQVSVRALVAAARILADTLEQANITHIKNA